MDVCNAFYGESRAFFESKNCGNTAHEIAHQPHMWRKLAESLKEIKPALDLNDARIILTGAGSSGFVGRAVAGFAAQLCGVHAEALHTTEIVSAPQVCFPTQTKNKKTVLISFARSGNSPESEGAVHYARKLVSDLYEIAIVCDGESKLARATRESEKGFVFVMPEGTNDKGFAMTSSVSTMLLAGLALLCPGKKEDIIADIYRLADCVEKRGLDMAEAAKKCSAWGFERAWYLGSGPFAALVQEGALKMMELSNGAVAAGSNVSAEFRHGPKTVLNPKTLTVHFISNNAFTGRYDTDLLNELYAQRDGNKVIALHNDTCAPQADLAVPYSVAGFSALADAAAGLQGLVFMQMLSMFTSLALGVGTDNPSPSGLVNRVVQGVTVYPL